MAWEITDIKRFVNKTNELVEVFKRQDPNDRVTLPPNSENQTESIHAPWVNNESDFNDRTIEIRYEDSNKVIYVWQHGEKIRYSKKGYENPGSAIPGNSMAGGEKTLIIENGYPSLI